MIEVAHSDQVLAPIVIADDLVIYAIGDIHGRLDLQVALEEEIVALHRGSGRRGLLIRLGDLIDRGPDSLAVLQRCAGGLNIPGLTEISIMGNHEHMMAAILERHHG